MTAISGRIRILERYTNTNTYTCTNTGTEAKARLYQSILPRSNLRLAFISVDQLRRNFAEASDTSHKNETRRDASFLPMICRESRKSITWRKVAYLLYRNTENASLGSPEDANELSRCKNIISYNYSENDSAHTHIHTHTLHVYMYPFIHD